MTATQHSEESVLSAAEIHKACVSNGGWPVSASVMESIIESRHDAIRKDLDDALAYASDRTRTLRKYGKQLLRLELLSESCCGKCEYDEAEGGLWRHCAACQERIVTSLYEITHEPIPEVADE